MEKATHLILILAAIVLGHLPTIMGNDIKMAVVILEVVFIYQLLFWTVYFKQRHKRIYNLHFLAVLTFGFFLGPRVVLDLTGQADIAQTNFFTSHKSSLETIRIALTNINLATFFFFLPSAFTSTTFRHKTITNKLSIKTIKKLQKFVLWISPLILFVIYLKLKFLFEKGYLAIFLGDEKIIFSGFFELVTNLYYLIFIFQLLHLEQLNKKIFWFHFIILLVVLASDGRRGPAMVLFFITIYFLQGHYIKNINLRSLLTIGSFIILILIFIGNYRFKNRGIDFSFISFFHAQGVSIQSIFYSIEYNSALNYNLIDLFGGTFRQLNVLLNKIIFYNQDLGLDSLVGNNKIYSAYLSSKVNNEMYYSGFGIGGSFIGELYTVGKETAQIIGSTIMGFIYAKLIKLQASNVSIFKKSIALIFIGSILYIPRDNMLDFLAENIYSILIVGLIGILIRLKIR